MGLPNQVHLAVRERAERLALELPALERALKDALAAYEAAQARLTSTRRGLDELNAFLSEHVQSELQNQSKYRTGEFLAAAASVVSGVELARKVKEPYGFLAAKSLVGPINPVRAANAEILARSRLLLEGGKSMQTRELYEALVRDGHVFNAQNPVARLSQLLSGSEWFIADRTHGWRLRTPEDEQFTEGEKKEGVQDPLLGIDSEEGNPNPSS